MTPPKHIQDVAIINASRGGIAAPASRNRPIGSVGREAGVAAAPSASVAVVSKRDGRAYRCPGRQQGAPSCGRGTTRLRFGVTAEFWAVWLSQTKAARRHAGGKCDEPFEWTPSLGSQAPAGTLPDRRKRGQGRGIAGPADACCKMLTWWGDNRRAHLNDQNGNWTPRSRFTRREVEVGASLASQRREAPLNLTPAGGASLNSPKRRHKKLIGARGSAILGRSPDKKAAPANRSHLCGATSSQSTC